MVVAIVALIASLSGTAYAALGKNTVGSKQLKSSAVKTGKIANNAVTSGKVADKSLTGADINLGALGTVPSATNAGQVGNANTVGGHAASCPPATTLIRGICFDSSSNAPAGNLKAAIDSCAAKGGYLPTPMKLYSTRTILNLGTGIESDHQYTSAYYGDSKVEPPEGPDHRTIVINGTGAISEYDPDDPSEYICAYPLVR
jgi:hypothetical protein